MNKYLSVSLIMLLLLIICVAGAFYSGGWAALKMSSVSTGMLTWHTFPDIISQLGHQKAYKKLLAVAWLGFSVPLIVWLVFLVMIIIALLPKKILYGDARLATDRDLQKSGFFPDKKAPPKHPPVLIGKMNRGKFKGKYLHFAGQQFLTLYAPTRSGKGVGIVIPNCINYPESMVVLDIKLENFFLSGGYRKKYLMQEVFLFCPGGFAESAEKLAAGEIASHRWNPLDCVSRTSVQRQTDLRKIAAILYPLTGGENDIWINSAINLFLGLGLYLMDLETDCKKTGRENKFPVSVSSIAKISVPQNTDLAKWMAAENDQPFVSDETKYFFNQFRTAPEKTRGSIVNTFANELGIFSNPVTAAATAASDFDIRDVRKKPMTVFLGLNPDTLVSHAKLVNLFFSVLINENVRELPEQNPELKYQCLILADEFTSMGRVEIIQKSVAFTAGYNMRWIFILQNLGQLEDNNMYGKEGAETFVENTGVEIFYPPKTVNQMAKTISEKIGVRDEKLKKRSKSTGGQMSHTVNYETASRAALLPEEVVTLRDKKNKSGNMAVRQIIFSDYCRPFIADKIVYFEERYFKKKVDYARQNPVPVPCLFSEEQRRVIAEEISFHGANQIMKKPDTSTHDTTDVSG